MSVGYGSAILRTETHNHDKSKRGSDLITVSPLTCLEPVLAKAQMEPMYLASALPLMGGLRTAARKRLYVGDYRSQEAIRSQRKNKRTPKPVT